MGGSGGGPLGNLNFDDPVSALMTVGSIWFAVPTGGTSLLLANSYEGSIATQREMEKSEKDLKESQAAQIKSEQDRATASAAAAAIRGQSFGDWNPAMSTGLGFGSGDAPASSGRRSLTGMS